MHDTSEFKIISVKLENSIINKADYLAKKGDLSRQRLIHNVLTCGVDEVFDKSLYFQLGLLVSEIKKRVLNSKAPCNDEKHVSAIPLKISKEHLGKIDVIATNWSSSKHDVMKKIITVGIDELEGADRIGFVRTVLMVRDIEDLFRTVCKKGQAAYKNIEEEEGI